MHTNVHDRGCTLHSYCINKLLLNKLKCQGAAALYYPWGTTDCVGTLMSLRYTPSQCTLPPIKV